jgi:Rad3-related DNA helicase
MRNGDDWDERARAMAWSVKQLCDLHPEDRILVHTVSYRLAAAIMEPLTAGFEHLRRPVYTYTNAMGRDTAIADYRNNPRAVLVAPSLERGVDFKDEDCRVQIIAKVPYPNIGDKMVSKRMNGPGGRNWYTTETVRSIVQMTGRGVRTETDHATSYILDAGFVRLWRESRRLFPAWWAEALRTDYPIHKLTRGTP